MSENTGFCKNHSGIDVCLQGVKRNYDTCHKENDDAHKEIFTDLKRKMNTSLAVTLFICLIGVVGSLVGAQFHKLDIIQEKVTKIAEAQAYNDGLQYGKVGAK